MRQKIKTLIPCQFSGDFNQANLSTIMPNLHQTVSCPTRLNKTLDHCYCKIPNSYKAIQRSSLGNSDHSCVLLVPKYKQKVKTAQPTTQTRTHWGSTAVESLQNCFEITDWNVFSDLDIHQYTDTVTEYIKFCESICIPTSTRTTYPNSNAWYNKHVTRLIKAKDTAYRNKINDPDSFRKAKNDLKKMHQGHQAQTQRKN